MNIKQSHIAIYHVDDNQFEQNLNAETNLLKKWFTHSDFAEEGLEAGFEIEFFILDKTYKPMPRNLEFIKTVNELSLIPEAGAAQLEINSAHFKLTGDCLTRLHQNISDTWKKCYEASYKQNYHLALIGSVPLTDNLHQNRIYITNHHRYQMLNENITALHGSNPFFINITGHEILRLIEPSTVCLGGLLSAFQLHLQVPQSNSVRFYNTVQIISAPMLALCANSPYFHGKDLWSESRIDLYEKAFFMPEAGQHKTAVDSFGTDYLTDSFFGLFSQNLLHFPRLITEVLSDSPLDFMFHVRRLNGTIYRWNRPVIDFDTTQCPHLRIEHRSPSTGPTIVDMIANAAFFYGIVNYYAKQSTPIEDLLPFRHAKGNFYNAARFGFNAKFIWFSGREIKANEILSQLIPLARKGLLQMCISKNDVDYYLNIIERRVTTQQNGSAWQRKFVAKYGKNFQGMLEAYITNQDKEKPVSDWK